MDSCVVGSTASFVCATIDHVFVVRWRVSPVVETMREVLAHLIDARRRLGPPLIVVSIVSAAVPVAASMPLYTPAVAERARVVDHLVDALYLVFEGGESQVVAGAHAGAHDVSRTFEIQRFDTADEALRSAAKKLRVESAPIIGAARDLALL
jgi:hypothetical protein